MSSATPPVLQLHDITKTFGSLVANDNISLTLRRGEMLALLGENGAGKTTLMNILFGHYVATQGHIEIYGKPLVKGSPKAALATGIGMVHQHFTLAENMTVLENIILGTEPLFRLRHHLSVARAKLLKLSMQFALHVDWNSLVRDLSIGQRQRVEILKALYRDVKILILDEPTAVLTPQESDKLFTTLRLLTGKGLSVIFITHKLKEALSGSDRCVVLRHGRVVYETATKGIKASTLAKAMVGGSLPEIKKKQPATSSQQLLSCSNISILGNQQQPLLDGINLHLFKGEILGIAGVSGNGQMQLADMLSGMQPPDSGEIKIDGKLITHHTPREMMSAGIGRIPEDRTSTGIIGDMAVRENIALESYQEPGLSRFGLLKFRSMEAYAADLINKFDIRCPSTETPVRNLSGGNIQKLILARVLSRKPTVLLASQPTWGLDVGATAFVHEQLLQAKLEGSGILLISEDLDELLQLSDRIQVLYKGKISEPVSPDHVDAATLGLAMSGHLEEFSQKIGQPAP